MGTAEGAGRQGANSRACRARSTAGRGHVEGAQHVPVLAGRVTALLAPALAGAGSVLADATLGRAGHARPLLEVCPALLLIGIGAAVAAIDAGRELLAPFADGFTLVHARYDEIPA